LLQRPLIVEGLCEDGVKKVATIVKQLAEIVTMSGQLC
jgi:hypothetical protein